VDELRLYDEGIGTARGDLPVPPHPLHRSAGADRRLRRRKQVKLRALVSGRVHREEHAAVCEEPAVDGLRKVRQLLERTAVRRKPVELRRPGYITPDEHRLAVARDVERERRPQRQQLS
jgi:hypothetical protein